MQEISECSGAGSGQRGDAGKAASLHGGDREAKLSILPILMHHYTSANEQERCLLRPLYTQFVGGNGASNTAAFTDQLFRRLLGSIK